MKYINYFPKMLRGSQKNSCSKYVWVLNISGSWTCLWLWICQSFEQTRVLNIPRFCIRSGSEFARVLNMSGLHRFLNMSELHRVLNMSEFAWLCLNMLGYAWICLNMPKYAWIAFLLYFPIAIFCLLESVATFSTFSWNWKF